MTHPAFWFFFGFRIPFCESDDRRLWGVVSPTVKNEDSIRNDDSGSAVGQRHYFDPFHHSNSLIKCPNLRPGSFLARFSWLWLPFALLSLPLWLNGAIRRLSQDQKYGSIVLPCYRSDPMTCLQSEYQRKV